MNMQSRLTFICVFLSAFLFAGCHGGNSVTHHVSENVDFSFVKKVAVLPLENQTSEKTAGDIVRHLVISELLASGLADVVLPGEVMHAVSDLGIKNIASLSKEQIISLGKTLRVQALIVGSVHQYGHVRVSSMSIPEVAITLMMADTGTGSIIWSVTNTRGGAGFMARHFGTKSESMSETVLAAVRQAVETLVEY